MIKSNKSCFILLADGFAEKSVSEAADFFQVNGLTPTFLSLYQSPITNKLVAQCGSGSFSTLLIGDIWNHELPDGLLLAGGLFCGQHLSIDPRVHRLIRQMHLAAKPVGLLYPIFVPLLETMSHLSANKPFLVQERQYADRFLHDFLLQMKVTRSIYKQPASLFI
jgi:hypothetical protein